MGVEFALPAAIVNVARFERDLTRLTLLQPAASFLTYCLYAPVLAKACASPADQSHGSNSFVAKWVGFVTARLENPHLLLVNSGSLAAPGLARQPESPLKHVGQV